MRSTVQPLKDRQHRAREVGWGIASLLVLVGLIVVLRPYRTDVDAGTVALVLLVAPLVAALASLRVAIASAVISALAFNYSFTEPYDSFAIEDPTSVVAFVMYFINAVAVALMVARVRAHAETSEERAAQAILLRELTIDLVRQNVWLQPPLSTALSDLVKALRLHGAALVVRVPDGEEFSIKAGRSERSEETVAALSRSGDAPKEPELGVMTLRGEDNLRAFPIATGVDVFGMLAVEPVPDSELSEPSERIVGLFANVVALACERAAYMHQAVQRQALEETDRLRTSLMQAVTHDLRTPLASINALASAIPELGELKPDQREMLDDVRTQAERLSRLVDQVLDMSRIESGTLKLRLETLPLDELVRAAADAVKTSTGATIEVALDNAPAVPVDEVLIKQALVNLLENAVRYGGAPFEVTMRERDSQIELRVIDHGPGIPEAERRRIFDPRHAMRRSSTDERSRGLGLAISAGFVLAHHGHVRAEPTPGGGATFVISLPKRGSIPSEAAP